MRASTLSGCACCLGLCLALFASCGDSGAGGASTHGQGGEGTGGANGASGEVATSAGGAEAGGAGASTPGGTEAGGAGGAQAKGNNEELVLDAGDDHFTLTIATGALPPGTDPKSVKVTPLDVKDFGDQLSGASILSAYRLEPDGLVLSQPATLRVSFDPAEVIELVAHHIGSGDETLPLQVVARSSDTLTLTAPLSHFSVVTFENSTVQRIETLLPPPDAFVGEPFSVRYRLTPALLGDKEYLKGAYEPLVTAHATALAMTWNVSTWDSLDNRAGSDGPIVPDFQEATREPKWAGAYRDFDFTFTCSEVGEYDLGFSGGVQVDATYTWTPDQSAAEPAVVCESGRCEFIDTRAAGGKCSSNDDCSQTTAVSDTRKVYSTENGATDFASCQSPELDDAGDFVDSISSVDPAFTGKPVDIVAYGAAQRVYTQTQVDALFNDADSVYPCGRSDQAATVVCGNDSAMPAGAIDTFFMQLAAPVPTADASKSYIYSAVLDSDDDTQNNWVPQAPYDWDYFQGADRWYQLLWDHATQGWSVTTTQVDDAQTTTTISPEWRALILGRVILFYINASELLAASPQYRVTAFGHDGAFTTSSRGGDVSGKDPTAPLTPVP